MAHGAWRMADSQNNPMVAHGAHNTDTQA